MANYKKPQFKPQKETHTTDYILIIFTLPIFVLIAFILNFAVLITFAIIFSISLTIFFKIFIDSRKKEIRECNMRVKDPCWIFIDSDDMLKDAYFKYDTFNEDEFSNIAEFSMLSNYMFYPDFKATPPPNGYCSWWHYMIESNKTFWYYNEELALEKIKENEKSIYDKNMKMVTEC